MTIESLPPLSRWRAPYAYVYTAIWKLRGLPTKETVFIGTARATKMRTRAGVFDTLGALLQFPPYFGENWNAFVDSLSDLEWLRASTILLVILDAENVLRDGARDELEAFVEYVKESIPRLAAPDVDTIAPVQLRVVFHTELADEETNDPYADFPFTDLSEHLIGS